MRVGFIGLGAMGAPMARNLAAAGLLAALWNRSRAKAEPLSAQLGVPIADDPAALARSVDCVLLSLPADDDLLQVIDRLCAGLHADMLVVDTSTVGADTAREASRRLTLHGAHFLDAPVSGGVEGARNGSLVMMVGGEAAQFERVRPLLAAVATHIVHMGPVGNGQTTKAVNQIMVAGINQAVTEALAFGEAAGLNMDRVIDVIGGGAAANWFLSNRGRSMLQRDFSPRFKVALHHKDLTICRRMAEALTGTEIRLPIVEMTLIHYRRLIEAGYADEDISALYRQKCALFGD